MQRLLFPMVASFLLAVVAPSQGSALSKSEAAPASQSAQSEPAPAAATRPCPAAETAKTPQKKSSKAGEAKPAAGTACLEIHGEGLQLQEFLQARIREEKWRVGEESIAEDSWFFVRYLDAEELAKFADTNLAGEQVDWASGRAGIEIITTQLAEGFSRVQISVRLEGYGKRADAFAPPRTSWPLASRGVLENALMDFLKTGFRPIS